MPDTSMTKDRLAIEKHNKFTLNLTWHGRVRNEVCLACVRPWVDFISPHRKTKKQIPKDPRKAVFLCFHSTEIESCRDVWLGINGLWPHGDKLSWGHLTWPVYSDSSLPGWVPTGIKVLSSTSGKVGQRTPLGLYVRRKDRGHSDLIFPVLSSAKRAYFGVLYLTPQLISFSILLSFFFSKYTYLLTPEVKY